MAMRSTTLVPLLIVLGAVIALVGGVWAWDEVQASEESAQWEAHRAEQEARREAREEQWFEQAGDESTRVLPPLLGDARLGMTVAQLEEARPEVERTDDRTDAEKFWLEERFAIGAQAMYGFDTDSNRLVQVQILSLLPGPEAVGPHLQAMHDTYGVPTGVWDCPDTEGVPTRRFTWRRGVTTVMDVFLASTGPISQTLYIASSEVIGRSLQMSQCRPVRGREGLRTFPAVVAGQERVDPQELIEQAQAAQEAAEGLPPMEAEGDPAVEGGAEGEQEAGGQEPPMDPEPVLLQPGANGAPAALEVEVAPVAEGN